MAELYCERECVLISMAVPDRETGRPTTIQQSFYAPPFLRDAQLVEWLLRCAEEVVMHELHECFIVDGEIRFDPHSKGGI
jgi:hypothetical protein